MKLTLYHEDLKLIQDRRAWQVKTMVVLKIKWAVAHVDHGKEKFKGE